MGRKSHSQSLGLWMNGFFVGTWTSHGETLQYADEWVQHHAGRPLSRSLPFRLGNRPYSGPAVEAWFENLLPDSKEIRERVARRYHTASTGAFDLLAEIGRDCVGALQLMPAGIVPAGPGPVQATALDEGEVARILQATVTPQNVLGASDDDNDAFRISIAGAQEKTALLFYQGKWQRPLGSTPTSHILKLPPRPGRRYARRHELLGGERMAVFFDTRRLRAAGGQVYAGAFRGDEGSGS